MGPLFLFIKGRILQSLTVVSAAMLFNVPVNNYGHDKMVSYPTVMILSFRTDRSGQTVQTQTRLLLEKQSDQGLHCLPFCLHRLDSLLYGRTT